MRSFLPARSISCGQEASSSDLPMEMERGVSWLARAAGWPLDAPWLALTLALYALAGACWLPVVWLQIRMARMAQAASAQGASLPPLYWRYARWWEALGYPAFVAMGVIYWLMVNKPALWGE